MSSSRLTVISGALAAFAACLLAIPIVLPSSDLGRHLANGRWIHSHSELLHTNFYSYTYPDFPFVNHHWGSGLILYWVQSATGYAGLSIFAIFLMLGACAIFYDRLRREHGEFAAIGALALALPLLCSRPEVRPELFSYVLFAALFWLVRTQKKTKLSWLAVTLFMAIWANLHIYFVIGFLFLILESLRSRAMFRALIASALAAALCNPLGPKLLLFPLRLFENYGYRVAENQSTWFLLTRSLYPVSAVSIVFLTVPILIAIFFARKDFVAMALAMIGLALAHLGVRHSALLGLMSLPALSIALSECRSKRLSILSPLALAPLVPLALELAAPHGLGLAGSGMRSIEFFKERKLHGPIFNNYDIGSFLIGGLFPLEKVFIDNRPEAYPAAFFADEYIPMQSDPLRWKAAEDRYAFNVIFFNWRDQTPPAQKFLLDRVRDPEWIPVYADEYVLIFVRGRPDNDEVIRKFSIPRERFSFRRP